MASWAAIVFAELPMLYQLRIGAKGGCRAKLTAVTLAKLGLPKTRV